jgi:hypothetical protein
MLTLNITINTDAGETLASKLAAAGIYLEPRTAPVSWGKTDAALTPGVFANGGLGQTGGVNSGNDQAATSETREADTETGKRKRRTKAEMEADRLAAEAAARGNDTFAGAAVTHADAQVWEVRRYGGELDSEMPAAKDAAERLTDLIKNAGDEQALNSLGEANADLVEKLPAEMAQAVSDAMDAALAAVAKPVSTIPEGPAPAPAWPMGENKLPLVSVSLDKQGARDSIFAIATGPEPKFGHAAGLALLQRHGVEKLSALQDGDDRFVTVAAEGAKLLSLPTRGGASLL